MRKKIVNWNKGLGGYKPPLHTHPHPHNDLVLPVRTDLLKALQLPHIVPPAEKHTMTTSKHDSVGLHLYIHKIYHKTRL